MWENQYSKAKGWIDFFSLSMLNVSKGKIFQYGFLEGHNVYGLLTKCEVKMAGYWPSSFFCLFMDRDGVEVHKLGKKERGQYPAILTKQAWSIKDLLYGFRGNFSCGTRRVVPTGQDSSILPARVANHSAGLIWFILPARGASRLINWYIESDIQWQL